MQVKQQESIQVKQQGTRQETMQERQQVVGQKLSMQEKQQGTRQESCRMLITDQDYELDIYKA